MTALQTATAFSSLLLLAGCFRETTHHLSTQLLRANGVLDVRAESDVRGVVTSVAGQKPHVGLLYNGGIDRVIVEPTRVLVRGEVWGELPTEARQVLVRFEGNAFTVEVDGITLPGKPPRKPAAETGQGKNSPRSDPEAKRDGERLRRTIGSIESQLGRLEGELRVGYAGAWRQQAVVAQQIASGLRGQIATLRQASLDVGNLDGWLTDLEGRLRGATEENWNEKASAAQGLIGNMRLEVQQLRGKLPD